MSNMRSALWLGIAERLTWFTSQRQTLKLAPADSFPPRKKAVLLIKCTIIKSKVHGEWRKMKRHGAVLLRNSYKHDVVSHSTSLFNTQCNLENIMPVRSGTQAFQKQSLFRSIVSWHIQHCMHSFVLLNCKWDQQTYAEIREKRTYQKWFYYYRNH